MNNIQFNQQVTLAEVILLKSCVSCVSSKIKPMESITYLLKLLAEVPYYIRRDIERSAPSESRFSISQIGVGV